MARKTPTLYDQLDAGFASGKKIVDCTVDAEHVWIRMRAHAVSEKSDGFFTLGQARRENEKLDRSELDAALENGIEVGLFALDDGLYETVDYLLSHKSRLEIEADTAVKTRRGLKGNHVQHHVNKGVVAEGCPLCAVGLLPRRTPSESQDHLGRSPIPSPVGAPKEEEEEDEKEDEKEDERPNQSLLSDLQGGGSSPIGLVDGIEKELNDAGHATNATHRTQIQRAISNGNQPDTIAARAVDNFPADHPNPKAVLTKRLQELAPESASPINSRPQPPEYGGPPPLVHVDPKAISAARQSLPRAAS